MPDETPTPPTSEPPPEAPADTASTGLPPNVAAGIAMIAVLAGGVLFLILERRSAFVRFYAMQSILLGAASLIASLVFGIVGAIFHLVPIVGGVLMIFLRLLELMFWIAWLLVWLVAVMKAFSNIEWEIPWLGRYARRQLARTRL